MCLTDLKSVGECTFVQLVCTFPNRMYQCAVHVCSAQALVGAYSGLHKEKGWGGD